MDKKRNFVATTSKETADELKRCGFRIVQEGNGKWLFLNDTMLNFDENENSKKVVYTDIMAF